MIVTYCTTVDKLEGNVDWSKGQGMASDKDG